MLRSGYSTHLQNKCPKSVARIPGYTPKFEGYDPDQNPEFDTKDYPRFVYTPPSFNDRIGDVFLDVLLLGIWNMIFFLGTYLSFLRCDVR